MPEIKTNAANKPHTLMLDNRHVLNLTGVLDVPHFDEQTITIKTDNSTLVVKGNMLHINKLSLDTGDVSIDGEINSLQYLNSSSKSLKSRLLR